jgi:hypothetical protein
MSAGTFTPQGKTNDSDSAIKDAPKYKPSQVKEIDREENAGSAVKSAARQNSSLNSDDESIQNVVPSGRKHTTTTSSGN